MVSLKEIFDHLRAMSGGTLTQLQVDATNNVISTMGVEVISNVLGETTQQGYQLTEATLRKLHSTANTDFVDIINKHAFNFGITNKKRMAMFLSHALHESNGFNTLQESFNYKPARLKAVFGSRIPSLNFATNLLAKGKEEVANHLYGGRYGNTEPNDGWLYSGKGIGGLTFKGNYQEMQTVLNKYGLKYDIVSNPMLLLDKEVATLTYMAYWASRNVNAYADKNDMVGSTRVINGGTNGLSDRIMYYERALKHL